MKKHIGLQRVILSIVELFATLNVSGFYIKPSPGCLDMWCSIFRILVKLNIVINNIIKANNECKKNKKTTKDKTKQNV